MENEGIKSVSGQEAVESTGKAARKRMKRKQCVKNGPSANLKREENC